MLERLIDVAVIGGGPAGLAAALAAAEGGAETVVVFDRQPELGGILTQCIHNGFGLRYFKEELTGPEYAQRFIDRLVEYPQIEVKIATMVLQLTADRQLVTTSAQDGLASYRAKAVILAMGCRERPRGAVNIPGTRPAGVFTAGTVQRLMNIEGLRPGNRAAILGSGDIGLIMARRLTLEGIKVAAVLELLPYSCGLNRNVVQCLDDFEIPLYLSHTVVEIYGEKRVTGVKVAPVDQDRRPLLAQSFNLDCDTLVLSVGLIPENELSRMAGVQIAAATAGPLIDSHCQTSTPGIFACGNVAHVHDLVDDVSEESRVAGAAAAAFVRGGTGNGMATTQKLTVRPGRNIRSVTPQEIVTNEPTVLYIRAAFPERDVTLKAGRVAAKQRIVTPGETIRVTIRPEQLDPKNGILTVSLEKGEDIGA
jgi:NADPH-dependent 2,4-dienoyl-CoA reductase/sulfur reductase-like enzyme